MNLIFTNTSFPYELRPCGKDGVGGGMRRDDQMSP
jgi:hypothetical protein